MRRSALVLVSFLVALTGPVVVPARAATAAPDLRSTVTVSVPNPTITAGTRTRLTGKVSGPSGRSVRAQLATTKGWRTVTRTTSSAGRYAVVVPTDWLSTHRIRIHVPASGRYASATSVTRTVTTRPGYTPRGSRSTFALLTSSRFDPCSTIPLYVNTTGAPSGAVRDVKRGARVLHRATGLRFSYEGTTTVRPRRDGRGGYVNPKGGLLVVWSTARTNPELAGATAGFGGFESYGREITNGFVMMDRNYRFTSRWGAGNSLAAILLHEMAHAVGVGHVRSETQLMSPMIPWTARSRFEAGDLEALRRVGASRGCV